MFLQELNLLMASVGKYNETYFKNHPQEAQKEGVDHDLAGACKLATAVVSVDAGPMHVAAAVGTPTLAVVGNDKEAVGASPIRLWQPRSPVLERTVSTTACTLCSDNRFKNDGCIAEEHLCMQGVGADQVIYWLEKRLG